MEVQKEDKHYLKNILGLCLILFCGLFISLTPGKAEAAWNSENIISDVEFTAKDTMTEQDIQDFLVSKNSFLANYTEPKSTLMGYPEREQAQGKSAAYIINWVAKEYGLNPIVIIVTLQKEQSSIQDMPTQLWNSQISSAMGYGCPDSGGCNTLYAGFARQVDWGSYQLRWNLDKANSTDPVQRAKVSPYYTGNCIDIDGTQTNLSNGATASLYRYTPHFHGNQLFYNIYTNWFNFGQILRDNIRLSSSLSLSNYAPAVGETVTNTYTIKNYFSSSLTFDKVVVAGRDSNGSPVDLDVHYNVTLAQNGSSGDNLSFADSRAFLSTGVHSVWVSVNFQGNWYSLIPDSGKTNYMTFNVHMPNLTATSFYFTPGTPIVGQKITATYTVKNNEAKDIKVDVLSVGNRLTTQWYPARDFGGYTDINIPAGQTVTLTVERTLDLPGLYVATVSAKIGNYWSELNWGNGVSSRSYYSILPFSEGITAVLPLTISNNNPSIGESVTATFRIRNKTSIPIVLDRVVVTGRTSSWAPKDFPVQLSVTLAPYGDSSGNDFYTPPVLATTFTDLNSYNFWISYLYAGNWYNVKPDVNQSTSLSVVTKTPNLTVNSFYFTPGTPIVGQKITATYTVKNNEAKDIKVDVLSVGNRLTTQWYPARDFGGYTDINIPAGQTVTLTVERTLDLPGLYVATVSAKIGNYWSELNWGNGVSSRSYFNVK